MSRFKFLLFFSTLAVLFLPQALPAAGFKKGVKLNTYMRITSLPVVQFLEKHGITIPDLVAAADLKNDKTKAALPLLNSLKPADFPYAFFYSNEFLFSRKFPGMFGFKIDNAAWIAILRTGLEQGEQPAVRVKNRFYKIPSEELLIELLPDGVLMLPSDEAAELPEIKSLQELHDNITAGMGIKPDDGAFVEYHEQSGFADINERLQMLFGSRWREKSVAAKQMAAFDKIFTRMLRNPFLKAMLSTKQNSLRVHLKDGLSMTSEYTLGDLSHKEPFLKSLSAMQVFGSIASTAGIAAWETQARGKRAGSEDMRVGMELFSKFSESFEKIRVSESGSQISMTWSWFTNQDLIPAMRIVKKLLEQKKDEQRAGERIEALRDEVCAALAEKNKEKIRTKMLAYAEILPEEEHKFWRVRQSCDDRSGILLSALEFAGEDVFLKLVPRLKYHMGFALMTNTQGKGFLHIAVERRYDKALRQLLDDGLIENAPDANGKTPLIYAIESKNAGTVKLLLDRRLTIISDTDVKMVKKTRAAAEASGNEKIKELVEAALKREQTLRKNRQTQI